MTEFNIEPLSNQIKTKKKKNLLWENKYTRIEGKETKETTVDYSPVIHN